MSVALDLTPAEELRLREAARRRGVMPEALAHELVVDRLPLQSTGADDPLVALLDQWDAEDASMTPEEMAAEREQWEALKANLNAERERAGSRRLF